ncbi:MAG: hypothetical protein BGO90_12205 [Legionella sp. 40-6]|nr:MAG: hypothetical protein BGO90_12205 [Legionella sp. 40-6]
MQVKDMNTIVSIEKVIKKIPRGRIFFVDSIYKKYPIKLVQRVLLRLAKSNEVVTICRGIYFRPEKSRYLPDRPIPPSTDKMILP